MTLLFIGILFLGAVVGIVIFGVLARSDPSPRFGVRFGFWTSVVTAILTGAYIWLFLHSLTIVTVTSDCPDYSRVVSAGDRHAPLIRLFQADYFAFVDPREGSVEVHGKEGVIASEGYVTSATMSTVSFSLDGGCRVVSSQVYW